VPVTALEAIKTALADQDMSAVLLGDTFQACRQVHPITNDRVVHTFGRPDIPGHHVTGVQAYADVDGLPAGFFQAFIEAMQSVIMRREALTARSGSSSWGKGVPKMAMMASPINLSSIPPSSVTTSTIRVK